MIMEKAQIEMFLNKVDNSFPVPLSDKQDLCRFAEKLQENATICAEMVNGEVVAAVFGYIQNVENNRGYISVVATVEEYRGSGFASKLVKQFLKVAEQKRLSAVHLYTAKSNKKARAMYEKIGFQEWKQENEPRPDDIHLIYYFQ